jgi:hypothetical protein
MQSGARRYRVNQERWLPEFGKLPVSDAGHDAVPELRWVRRAREVFSRWRGRSRSGSAAS